MKKTMILGTVLCLLLTGCSPGDVTDSDTQPDALAVQVAQEKAAYYKQLEADIQEELISVRAEYYEKCTQYEARISALEKQLQDSSNTDSEADEDEDVPIEESPFRFRIENGCATLLTYEGKGGAVEIPSSFEGYPVTTIADRAFENCIRLESVSVPEGVLTVGWFAFSGCVHLTSVTLPESVRSISYGAFLNCNSDMTITCPKGSYADAYAGSYGIGVKR